MVIDALAERLFGQACDHNGAIAASGQVNEKVASNFLRESFFRARPPKTAGREEFGREFARELITRFSARRKRDAVATATALTVLSIARAIERFVLSRDKFSEIVASGGGTRNPTLMAWLANEAGELGLKLRTSDEFGIPSEAKEAVAFAVLAFETWHRRPSNVPSATGARRPAVLGKVSYP
jgi:anhydro-N-acetylmuramic acid kinase